MHCCDARKLNRPLYQDMRALGFEHFHCAILEETDDLDAREQYWIRQFESNVYGYNQNYGGAGNRRCEPEKVFQLWEQGLSVIEIGNQLGYDRSWIAKILSEAGISTEAKTARKIAQVTKPVCQYDIQTLHLLAEFPSAKAAAAAIGSPKARGVISRACLKGIKSHGFLWAYQVSGKSALTYPTSEAPPSEVILSKFCKCGAPKSRRSCMCRECYKKRIPPHVPSATELIAVIRKYGCNLSQIGRHYGISDNAVRGWLRHRGLPAKKSDLLVYLFNHENQAS